MRFGCPEHGQPLGLQEVHHGSHHECIVLWAHKVLYCYYELVQCGEAQRRLSPSSSCCHCCSLAGLHCGVHAVFSCPACVEDIAPLGGWHHLQGRCRDDRPMPKGLCRPAVGLDLTCVTIQRASRACVKTG